MAILKAVNLRASLGNAIRYITKKEKTEAKLISGYNCREDNPLAQMTMTKKLWEKTGGRQYKHFIISFAKDENITHDEAHKIALEFIEKWHKLKGFEVCLATHKDREHIHSHFIVNSVNSENGKMFHQSKRELTEAKLLMNEILKEHCKSVLEVGSKSENMTTDKGSKYRAIEKAATGNYKSYMLDMAVAVSKALEKAVSKNSFIELLKEQNIAINWSDARKYITFTDSEGHKVRNSNLCKTFKMKLSKNELTNTFLSNRNAAEKIQHNTKEEFKDEFSKYIENKGAASSGNIRFEDDTLRQRQEDREALQRAVRSRQINRQLEQRKHSELRKIDELQQGDVGGEKIFGENSRTEGFVKPKRPRNHEAER